MLGGIESDDQVVLENEIADGKAVPFNGERKIPGEDDDPGRDQAAFDISVIPEPVGHGHAVI